MRRSGARGRLLDRCVGVSGLAILPRGVRFDEAGHNRSDGTGKGAAPARRQFSSPTLCY